MQVKNIFLFLLMISFVSSYMLQVHAELGDQVKIVDQTTTLKLEVDVEKKVETKKKRGYQGEELKHENMAFFDNVISLAPQTIEELIVILRAAEEVLRQGQQKTLVDVDASRDALVKTFEKFANDIQKRSEYILPVLDESLEKTKLAMLGITLADGKSFLRAYALSTDKPSVFFKEHIKTSEQLLQFAVEMFVYLSDFKRNLRKTRGAYKRDLERKKHVKEEEELNKKRQELGEKEQLDPV